MGKMTDILNMVQETRQTRQDRNISDLIYAEDGQQKAFKKIMLIMVIGFACSAIAAVFIGNTIYNLESSLKRQEKRFDNLTVFLRNSQNVSDNQIQDFDYLLKNEADERKIQINDLNLTATNYYINTLKSIHANTLQLGYLDKYTQQLEAEIKKISVSQQQLNPP